MSATIELYEDRGDEWRFRLRHENGNITMDSGEGYASKSGAMEAIDRLRSHIPDADILDVERAAFEVYEDAAGEWRWRLRHRNGNVVADSGEGYSSRSAAEDAIDSVKRVAPSAEDTEIEAEIAVQSAEDGENDSTSEEAPVDEALFDEEANE